MTSIHNDWKVVRTVNVYENKQHALAQLICDASEGKRIYVTVGRALHSKSTTIRNTRIAACNAIPHERP